jgi:hypothetical protein
VAGKEQRESGYTQRNICLQSSCNHIMYFLRGESGWPGLKGAEGEKGEPGRPGEPGQPGKKGEMVGCIFKMLY